MQDKYDIYERLMTSANTHYREAKDNGHGGLFSQTPTEIRSDQVMCLAMVVAEILAECGVKG